MAEGSGRGREQCNRRTSRRRDANADADAAVNGGGQEGTREARIGQQLSRESGEYSWKRYYRVGSGKWEMAGGRW